MLPVCGAPVLRKATPVVTVLAKANRVLTGNDFRAAVRRGRRVTTAHAVVYRYAGEPETPIRFGFIVTKAIGGAVVRNSIRRRLRSISRDIVQSRPQSSDDIVVRVLPGLSELPWKALQQEITEAVHRSEGR